MTFPTTRLASSITLATMLAAPPVQGVALAQEHVHPAGERLGTVRFATSCAAGAQPAFDRAVSLLHSFEFGPTIAAFETTLAADPGCAMAEWGIALSHWGNPFAVGARPAPQVQRGAAAVDRARAIGAKTARERAYIEAAAHLYGEAATRPQVARVQAYRDAMATLSRQFPDDVEAAIFHALALTAAEDLDDKTYASRLRAVGILEPLFAKYPDHPGLAHYIIHSYDVPALAPRALAAARRYAEIAPSAPHALHMPSHTFTRVGQWQASIDTNIASAKAARAARATGEELHATDYQMYAYLQTAQDGEARRLLEALPEIVSRFDAKATQGAAPVSAAYFAMTAVPARWALERGAWTEAAALPSRPTGLPYVDALTEYARAIGGARSGNLATARTAVARLQVLHEAQSAAKEPYWTEQIRIQHAGAAAWLAFAEGRTSEALAQMRAFAAAEDRTEKAAVTPGPLAPAREQLAEMLLVSGDAAAAQREFETALIKEPNRFRALAGAARAATAAGDRAAATRHLATLVATCERAQAPVRPELQAARASLAR